MNGSGDLDTEDSSEAGGGGSWQPEAVIVPMLFALIFLVGTVGNALVLAVLLHGGQAVSTTNLFILNLGVADLCFIVCCVPFQATLHPGGLGVRLAALQGGALPHLPHHARQ